MGWGSICACSHGTGAQQHRSSSPHTDSVAAFAFDRRQLCMTVNAPHTYNMTVNAPLTHRDICVRCVSQLSLRNEEYQQAKHQVTKDGVREGWRGWGGADGADTESGHCGLSCEILALVCAESRLKIHSPRYSPPQGGGPHCWPNPR